MTDDIVLPTLDVTAPLPAPATPKPPPIPLSTLAVPEVVSLLVDGKEFSGWKEIRVTRGMERAASDFDLGVSERWPISQPAPEPWRIRPGAACVLKVNGDTVLTGWVDSYRPKFTATSHDVRVTGRSKTGDFVDSSVVDPAAQFKGMTLEALARKLAEPFKIEVVAKVTGEPIPEVQLQQGETCFGLIERLSRLQEYLITDDPDGRLILTRAGNDRCSSTLKQGVNVAVAEAVYDDAHRFSDYMVKAQKPGDKTSDLNPGEGGEEPRAVPFIPGESAVLLEWRARRAAAPRAGGGGKGAKVLTQITGTVKDPGIHRYRPKVIVAETQASPADAAKRADWEMRRRVAKAHKATVTVVGWRQADRRLWTVNEMVPCEVDWLSLERDMLISEVTYTMGPEGQNTRMELTLPDAFLPDHFRKAVKPPGNSWQDLVKVVPGAPPTETPDPAHPPVQPPPEGHH
jgi:prophage tail gpP-like protein